MKNVIYNMFHVKHIIADLSAGRGEREDKIMPAKHNLPSNICPRCGHDRRGIAHNVYTNCARNKIKYRGYKQMNMLCNYLDKLDLSADWIYDDKCYLIKIGRRDIINDYYRGAKNDQ